MPSRQSCDQAHSMSLEMWEAQRDIRAQFSTQEIIGIEKKQQSWKQGAMPTWSFAQRAHVKMWSVHSKACRRDTGVLEGSFRSSVHCLEMDVLRIGCSS